MKRKKRKPGGRGFETWMLGCEPGAEGRLGRLLDPLTSGRVGGATGEGDVKNTHRSEKSGWGDTRG